MATENEKRIEDLKTDLFQKALAYGIAAATYDHLWTAHRMSLKCGTPLPPLVEAAVYFNNAASGDMHEAAKALHAELLRQGKEEVANEAAEAKPVVRAVDEVGF